jgi:hypothetical protein
MCVGGKPSTQQHRALKRRSGVHHANVLQNEGKGVRDGIVVANAVSEVLAIGPMSIMVGAMNPAGRGCVERARRSR